MRGLLRRSILLVGFTIALAGAAMAENFPSKPVKILVPYPPGGAVDILTRTIGQPLCELWRQPVVIDNRPGAGATIATQIAAKSAPDGYTLLMVASGHAINPLIYRELPYDTLKDFVSIAEIGFAPNIVLVGKDAPAQSIAELIALARAQPGKLS